MSDLKKTKLIIDIIRCANKQELEKELNNSCDAECMRDLPRWVTNLLYFEVRKNDAKIDIPEDVFRIIEKRYLYNQIHNEIKIKNIMELSQEFNKNDIDYAFLKGASQLITTYKDCIGLRLVSDIDLLIRKKDLLKIEDILSNLGYKENEEKGRRAWFLKKHFHLSYFKNPILLELHWDIMRPKDIYRFNNSVTLRKIFEITEEIIIGKNKIKILRPSGNIFILCTHLIRHLYCVDPRDLVKDIINKKDRIERIKILREQEIIYLSISSFLELKRMLRYYGERIDWDDLFFLARVIKKEYEVFALLFLAKKVANADIPEFILARLKRNIFTSSYIDICKEIKYYDIVKLFRIYRIFCRLVNMQLLILNPLLLFRNFYLRIYGFYILYLRPGNFIKRLMRGIRRKVLYLFCTPGK